MSVDPILSPTRPGAFVHPLLRARDWQDRPEFGELLQWWKDGGFGVCALVGIGGAGKTAIAERFLQVLPGGYPEHPRVPKDRRLAAPARLFVFSFYDAPNPDRFFNELAAWLEGRSRNIKKAKICSLSYQQTLEFLAKAGNCLLVLDGLEKVQDDGSRGGAFGHILDGHLRDFVLRAADGWLPHVSLAITSRFRLYDPLASRRWYYRQIEVEKLQPPAALQLLRDRGVRGRDEQLEHLAREQGYHALSIDLVGGYISHFCGGDPQQFSSLTPARPKPADHTDLAMDPRIAAIREQERKFARLAEQYHQALTKSDPAALALLQRVCLFRLGVEVKTLAAIFTGLGKESISGPALAGLNEEQLQAKLRFLFEMRLVEASKSQKSRFYTIHPAIRDGFLKKLDAKTARLGHNAARRGLEASLASKPGAGYPSDPATLDLLEEIIFHALAAGLVQEAWDIYWNRTGHYSHLGRRLGAPRRGMRLCGYFITADKEAKLKDTVEQSYLFNNMGLFCRDLGMLAEARQFYNKSVQLRRQSGNAIALGIRNLAHLCIHMGHLAEAYRCAKAAKAAKGWSDSEVILASALIGRATFLMGDTTFGINAFNGRYEGGWARDASGNPMFYPALWKASAMYHMGRKDNALMVIQEIILAARRQDHSLDEMRSSLMLAEFSIHEGKLSAIQASLDSIHRWALKGDETDLLCWSALVRAKSELSLLNDDHYRGETDASAKFGRAALALEDGLRIACQCGYGIYHIDLLLLRAQLALHEGRATDAERDVCVALDEGVHPPAESGFPELLAASDPECLYAWGIAEGRQLLAEALLLQAAQKLGQAEFVPKRLDRLPADVRDLIDRAREQLDQALQLWRKLKDPESDAELNPKGERTKRVLEGLDGGILTEYPLVAVADSAQTSTPQITPQEPAVTPPPAASVFICYAQKDNQSPKRWLDHLLEFLSPLVRQGDLAVFSDQQLKIGDEWHPGIQRQLEAAKVAVLLVSPAFLASKYIANSELPVLLRRRSEEGLKILPVLLSPSLYDKTRFRWPDPKTGPEEFTLSSLQAAGSPKKTLSEMTGPQRNRAFVALAERILEIVGAKP